MITDFCLPHDNELSISSAKPNFFFVGWGGGDKVTSNDNNYAFLSLKQLFSPCWGLKGKNVFISLFKKLTSHRETHKLLKW